MPRVVVVCTDNASCEGLRHAFQSHSEFEIVGGIKDDTDTISKASEARPDLVVLEIAGDPKDGLNTAEKLQCICPAFHCS
jgi:DNA-binding NarL/FixJ family response regulator